MAKISIDRTMQDIVFINNQLAGLKMLLDQKKSIMAKFFQKSGEKSVSNDEATVFVQERTKVDYDVDAILKKVDKKLAKKFIDRTYTVSDWDGFIAMLKRVDVPLEKIRPFISIKREVNQEKLSKLYEQGKLSIIDLEGCYEATTTQSVALRMKNAPTEIQIAHE